MTEVYMMGGFSEGWGERVVYRAPHLLSGLLQGGSPVAIIARPKVISEIVAKYCSKSPWNMIFYPGIEVAIEDLRNGVLDSYAIIVDPDMPGSDEFLQDQVILDMKSGAHERVGVTLSTSGANRHRDGFEAGKRVVERGLGFGRRNWYG